MMTKTNAKLFLAIRPLAEASYGDDGWLMSKEARADAAAAWEEAGGLVSMELRDPDRPCGDYPYVATWLKADGSTTRAWRGEAMDTWIVALRDAMAAMGEDQDSLLDALEWASRGEESYRHRLLIAQAGLG